MSHSLPPSPPPSPFDSLTANALAETIPLLSRAPSRSISLAKVSAGMLLGRAGRGDAGAQNTQRQVRRAC